MTTFDGLFARLLLEICRYTYAAGFNDEKNQGDKQDALAWIRNTGGFITQETTLLVGSVTSIACIASYPDRNIVAYMDTKTHCNTFENIIVSIDGWHKNIETLLKPFKLSSEQLGAGHPPDVDKDYFGGRLHEGFPHELAAAQAQVTATLPAN
jgi:hypothetical protein